MWLTPFTIGLNPIFALWAYFGPQNYWSPSMRFDTAQVLKLVGITSETLRHWKRALPPIYGRDGRSDGYTFQEAAALAVIARAVHDLAVPISRFTPIAEHLFSKVAALAHERGDEVILCITGSDVLFVAPDNLPDADTMAIVRINSILTTLKRSVSSDPQPAEVQLDLPFQDATVVGIRIKRLAAR
jgi:hypothetical protein